MGWLERIWHGFGRLRWRLSFSIMGVVLLTTVVIAVLVAANIDYFIGNFLKGLKPTLSAALEKEFERFEQNGWDLNYDLDTVPELILPIFIPVLVGLIVAITVAARIAKPLEAISRSARRVAKGDFSARVEINKRHQTRQDEATELARNFNTMAQNLEQLETERRFTAAAIAHELRTPITVLHSRLQAVKDGLITVNQAEAEVLLSQTELLTRLVDDLRTLSLAEAGRLQLEQTQFDFAVLLQTTLQGFQAKAAAKEVQLELSAQACPITADASRLQQVLQNLLENALRHAPSGSKVLVRLEASQTGLRLEVRDFGSGIPAEALPHLFERFYRAETSRSRETGGTGLGLAVVKAIVEAHSGSVNAQNHATGGAVFLVQLPSD
jgi:two-component system, OmpR family, sensor histidine kinase BaeS